MTHWPYMLLFTMKILTVALSHLAGAGCWGQKQDRVSSPMRSSDTQGQEPGSLRGQMDGSENSMGGVGVGAELILSHSLNIFTKLFSLWETLPATIGLMCSFTS